MRHPNALKRQGVPRPRAAQPITSRQPQPAGISQKSHTRPARSRGWAAPLALAAVLLALGAPALAAACGLPLGGRIVAEQALISYANGRQELITSVRLQSDQPGAAVIFPVPGAPEVSLVEQDGLFDYLAQATRPPPGSDAVGGGNAGVSVLGREQIGGYDVARLAASDLAALEAWLSEHGYQAPAGAGPILQAYLDEGWKFVAVKLALGQPADGQLQPLRLAFDTPKLIYPMRLDALADAPIDLLLYVAADQEMAIGGLAREYAGPVATLDPPPPPGVAELLRAPYITRLRGRALEPARLLNDFVASPAGGGRSLVGAVVGVVLVFISSWVALGFAFGLRKRISAAAGPDPDDEEDR